MHVDQTERIDNPEAPAKAKKRGRPPKTKAILRDPDAAADAFIATAEADIGRALVYQDHVEATVSRYRADVANFETLDDARKNYALDLLDRLLAELRG